MYNFSFFFLLLARKFATEALEKQKAEFQSWGILADWNNCYRTFDKEYIVDQIKLFWDLYQKVNYYTMCFSLCHYLIDFLRVYSIDNTNQ